MLIMFLHDLILVENNFVVLQMYLYEGLVQKNNENDIGKEATHVNGILHFSLGKDFSCLFAFAILLVKHVVHNNKRGLFFTFYFSYIVAFSFSIKNPTLLKIAIPDWK